MFFVINNYGKLCVAFTLVLSILIDPAILFNSIGGLCIKYFGGLHQSAGREAPGRRAQDGWLSLCVPQVNTRNTFTRLSLWLMICIRHGSGSPQADLRRCDGQEVMYSTI